MWNREALKVAAANLRNECIKKYSRLTCSQSKRKLPFIVPTVFVQNGYRVSFYSYDLAERIHVHVFKGGHECKIWLDDLTVAFNHRFKPNEIGEIRRMVAERRPEIVERWLEHGRNAN